MKIITNTSKVDITLKLINELFNKKYNSFNLIYLDSQINDLMKGRIYNYDSKEREDFYKIT